MKNKHLNIILILLSFCSYSAHCQICVISSPVLTSVSVQPETGKTEFTWILSQSPDIDAYILYSYKGIDGLPIDTVWDPAATSHTISNTAPKYSSVSYVVAAYRLSSVPGMQGCVSPLSNVLSTIFCEADVDTCNKKVNVLWNRYTSESQAVISYSIMLSINGGEYNEEAVTAPADTSIAVNNFVTDANYCFYVRADLEDGSFSTSNKACVLTRMQRPPGWINADYASVNADSKINISFSVDPESEITHFLLERKTGQTGTFGSLAQLESNNGSILYTDAQAAVNVTNYYRLSAINSCKNPITLSNIASNMVLILKSNGNELNLSWNSYREWLGMVSEYKLFIDTGNGFVEKAVIGANDSLYTLDYKNIMYEVAASDICMYISASEISNPYGIAGQSFSSKVCMEPIEVVTVPNIFTPNNDFINDLFKPVLSFIPTNYHLIISEQHGSVLFETRDYNESWDGTRKGSIQPDGICLWFLKVTTPSGKHLSRSGTVTILKNP
jgi:gliding motility-associated-like protein